MTLDLLEPLIDDCGDPSRTMVVGLGGFPFTGKTTLARAWVARWHRPALHLPTESAILSREVRRERSLDGCAAGAHNLALLRDMILALRSGQSVVLPRYEWSAGEVGGADLRSIERGGLIVVDGSVACEPEIAELCDIVVFTMPQSSGWIEDAVQRDVNDRFWSEAESEYLNILKIGTVVGQYRRLKHRVDLVLGCSGRLTQEEVVHYEIPFHAIGEQLAHALSASIYYSESVASRPTPALSAAAI